MYYFYFVTFINYRTTIESQKFFVFDKLDLIIFKIYLNYLLVMNIFIILY